MIRIQAPGMREHRGLCCMQKQGCQLALHRSSRQPAPVGIIDVALLDAPGQHG